MPRRLIVSTALLVLLLPRTSASAVILFTSETDFLAAAGSLSFEGFENTAPGQTGSSRILDGFILSDPGGFGLLEIINNPSVAAEGSQAVAGDNEIDFFAFTARPSAFGFSIFGFGDEGSNALSLVLTTLSGDVTTIPLATSADPFSAFRFFGVISSTPFDGVRIRLENPADFVAVDAVHFGTPVPEPGAGVLLAGALGALLARRVRMARARR